MKKNKQKKPKRERLHIFINSFCNNGCLFCSDVHYRRSIPVEVLEKNARKDLALMAGKKEEVLFTASEPTLNPNLNEFIALARSYKYKSIGVITNGRKLKDKKYARSLFESGLTEINVSLHGSVKQIHDKITRVKGSFEETFLGICNLSLLKKEFNFDFFVNFTINSLNYYDIPAYLNLISSFSGLDGIIFGAVLPKGRAAENFNLIVPPYSDVGKIIKEAVFGKRSAIEARNFPQIFILGLPPCVLDEASKHIVSFELPIIRDLRSDSRGKMVKALWEKKEKGILCSKCEYSRVCDGVWESYIQQRGWKEFKPIKFL